MLSTSPSLTGPLTLCLAKPAPAVSILLRPAVTGFLQTPGRSLNDVYPKDRDTGSSQKKAKSSCWTSRRVYTELDFKKDIGLLCPLSYTVEIQGNFHFDQIHAGVEIQTEARQG